MSLEIYVPRPPLSAYVEMIWAWDNYAPSHPKERILPGGMMEITISLTDVPFRVYSDDAASAPQSVVGAMAAGARSTPFIIETREPMSLLSVWFKPGGALPFFGTTGSEIHNLHLPLSDMWGCEGDTLVCRLREASSTQARFHLLETVLTKRLCRAKQRHRAVDYALQLFRAAPESLKIAQVVDEIALSPTRFIQVFREDVGLTPKQFCRVQRFQQVTKHIAAHPTVDWADVALTFGYYDQSHFINEFRAFSGITPSDYAPQSIAHNTNLPVSDEG